jgi:hypothetical protein
MADYSKKALYLRKEVKQFEVEYDLNALKAATFIPAGVAVDTGINLPAGMVTGVEIVVETAIENPGDNAGVAELKLFAGNPNANELGGLLLLLTTGLAAPTAGKAVAGAIMRTVSASDLYLRIETAQAGGSAAWDSGKLKIRIVSMVQPS